MPKAEMYAMIGARDDQRKQWYQDTMNGRTFATRRNEGGWPLVVQAESENVGKFVLWSILINVISSTRISASSPDSTPAHLALASPCASAHNNLSFFIYIHWPCLLLLCLSLCCEGVARHSRYNLR